MAKQDVLVANVQNAPIEGAVGHGDAPHVKIKPPLLVKTPRAPTFDFRMVFWTEAARRPAPPVIMAPLEPALTESTGW